MVSANCYTLSVVGFKLLVLDSALTPKGGTERRVKNGIYPLSEVLANDKLEFTLILTRL